MENQNPKDTTVGVRVEGGSDVAATPVFSGGSSPRTNPFKGAGKKAGIAVLAFLLVAGGAFAVFRSMALNNQPQDSNAAVNIAPVDLPLEDLVSVGQLGLGSGQTLSVNGQLRANNSLVIAPTAQSASPTKGYLYYDQTTNQLAYFNGTEFVALTKSEVTPAQIAALQSQIATVTGQIPEIPEIPDLPADLASTTSANTFTALNTFSGGLNASSLTVTGTSTMGPTTMSSLVLSSPLGVASGGTGATSLTVNGVLVGQGSGAVTSLTSGTPGECLVSTAGAPIWSNCAGASIDTLQAAYTASIGGTTPEIKLDATRGALDIQDANATLGASLFNVRASNAGGLGASMFSVGNTGAILAQNSVNSATAFRVQNAAGTTTVLNVNTTTPELTVDGNLTLSAGRSLIVTGSGAFPGSPVEGQVYYRTDTDQLYVYTGTKWQADRSTATKIVAANDSQNKEKADYVADGTNDQVEINAAIAAVPATGGKVVLLDGTYNIGDTITMNKDNVVLTGSGNSTVLNKVWNQTTDGVGVITVSADNTLISELKILGNKATYTNTFNYGIFEWVGGGLVNNTINGIWIDGTKGNGIYAYDNTRLRLTNNTITNVDEHGMRVNNSTDVIISNNDIEGIGIEGIFAVATNELTVANNTVRTTASGINVSLSGNSTISGNVLRDNITGVIVGQSGHTVTGNIIANNLNNGIIIDASAAVNQITISSNTIIDNIGRGVYVNGNQPATGININANNISNNGSSSIAFGITGGNISDSLITNNRIDDNTGSSSDSSIFIGDGDNNQITGNRITDTAGTGFAIVITSGGVSNYLADNTYAGTGAASISDASSSTQYASQLNSSNKLVSGAAGALFKNTADNTTAFQVQKAGAGGSLFTVDTTNDEVEFGNASVAGKLVISDGSSNTATLQVDPLAGNFTYTLPTVAANATICTDQVICTGYAAASGSGNYIQNGTVLQTNANIAIQSVSDTDTTLFIKQRATQSADLINVQAAGSTDALFSVNTFGQGSIANSFYIGSVAAIGGAPTSTSHALQVGTGGDAARVGLAVSGAFGQTANIADFWTGNEAGMTYDANGKLTFTGQLAAIDVNEGYLNTAYGGIGQYGNLLTKSEQFDALAWTPTDITVTANDVPSNPAPNRTASADKLESGTGGSHTIHQTSSTAPTNDNYTFSVWIKSPGASQPFTLQINGATSGTGTPVSYNSWGEWARYSVTQNTNGFTGNIQPVIILTDDSSSVVAWGAQLVKGSTPQVYSATDDAALSQYLGATINGALRVGGATPGGIELQASDGSGGSFDLYSGTGNLVFYGGFGERGIVTNTGNWGLGLNNWNPNAKLHVRSGADTANDNGVNLFQLTDNTTGGDIDVFTVADEGASTFRNRTDSANAFQVQNAAGTISVFNVDTSNSRTTATGTLFVNEGSPGGNQYSLRVEPTSRDLRIGSNVFGYPSVGNTDLSSVTNIVSASQHNSGPGGPIDAVYAYFPYVGSAPNNKVKIGIYSDSSNAPDALLGNSDLSNGAGTALTAGIWNRVPLTTPLTLTANTNYWIAFNVSGSGFGTHIGMASSGGLSAFDTDASGGNDFDTDPMDATFGVDGTDVTQFAAYSPYSSITDPTYSSNGVEFTKNNELHVRPMVDSQTAFGVWRANGVNCWMCVDSYSGTTYFAGTEDAALNSNGIVQIGSYFNNNLVFDIDEIMARNNGAAATLFLQNEGGGLTSRADTNTFRSTNDTATAFQIQNANGDSILNVDTTLGQVTLAGSTDNTELVIKNSASQSFNKPQIVIADSAGAEISRITAAPDGNLFMGYQSGQNAVAGALENSAFGTEALEALSTGDGNVAMGFRSLFNVQGGNSNTAVGWGSAENITGGDNVAIGAQALRSPADSSQNVAIGVHAGNVAGAGANFYLNNFIGYSSGNTDDGGNFSTVTNLQRASAIGAWAQVQQSDSIVLGSIDHLTKVGIGTTRPDNLLSVSPKVYDTGTACQGANSSCNSSGAIITGTGTSWSEANGVRPGMRFIFADGSDAGTIVSVDSTTQLTVTNGQIVSGQHYRIHSQGFNVTSAGNAFVQNTSATAFQVQNAAGSSLFTVDSSGSNINMLGNNAATLSTWTSTTAMSVGADTARVRGGAVAANGYLYHVGGNDGTGTVVTTVQSAKINTDGTIGTWAATTSLPLARRQTQPVILNGYIYVIGGRQSGSGAETTSYFAKLNNDGTVGPWNTSTALPSGRFGGSTVTYNGYIYYIGGHDTVPATSSNVYYIKANPDGTLGPAWTQVAASLPVNLSCINNSGIVANGYIYIAGGCTGSPQNDIYYSKVGADGVPGSWSTASNVLATNGGDDENVNLFVANGYLYVVGGDFSDRSVAFPLNADGSLGTEVILPDVNISSTTIVGEAGNAQANGYFYLLGGSSASDGSGTKRSSVYYTSAPRVKIGGNLDLVGYGGENLNEGGTGGTLTAGNTRIVGTLNVNDAAYFMNNASVNGDLSVAGATATEDLTIGSAANVSAQGHVFADGYESGNTELWTSTTTSGSSSQGIDTTFKHFGKYGYRTTNNNGSSYLAKTITSGSAYTMRAYVYISSHTSGNADLITLYNGTNSFILYRDQSTGTLRFWNGVTSSATNSGVVITTNAWHELELGLTINASTGTVNAYLDGVNVGSLTGQNTGSTNISSAIIGDTNSGRAHTTYFDDVVVDTVRPGDSSSLYVADTLHVAGSSSFAGSQIVQNASGTRVFGVFTNANMVEVGARGSSSAPAFLRLSDAASGASGAASLIGSWASSNNWGIGANSNASDSVLRFGTTTAVGGQTWNTAQNLNAHFAGTLKVQPTTGNDSTTAFQVQNAAGTPLMTADTTNFQLEVAGGLYNAGITWTSRTASTANAWRGIAYGNGRFVAIAYDGVGNNVMTSPDGINWTTRTTPNNNDWTSVTYGNGIFVAVAESNGGTTCNNDCVMTSSDGITWTSRTSAANNDWSSVNYGNGLFVAVSDSGSGNRVMTSPDGINWTIRSSASNNNWRSVTYANGTWVAVGRSGNSNDIMTSTDGITWTNRSTPANNSWQGVTYGNGLFVAVSNTCTGNCVMTSPTGVTWTSRTSAADLDWRSVTYGNGLFVAVALNGTGNGVMTSPDGITWTSRAPSANNNWVAVTFGNGTFVATSTTGASRVMTSGKQNSSPKAYDNTYHGGQTVYGSSTFRSDADATNTLQVLNSAADPIFQVGTIGESGNLVTNGSIETNATGYGALGSATATRVTTQAFYGSASLQVAGTSIDDGFKYDIASLASSTQYTASFHAKTSSGTPDIDYGVSSDGTSGTEVDCKSNQGLTTNWKIFNCTFTTGTVSGTPYFYARSDNASNTFFVDGFHLVPGDDIGGYYEGTIKTTAAITSPLTIQGTTANGDGANFFQIQNASGETVFTADTATRHVGIGVSNARAALQVATATNSEVNQIITVGSSQTGDAFQIRDGNQAVYTHINSKAELTVKPITDSAASFLVETNAGADVLKVDTASATPLVTIGGHLMPDAAGTRSLGAAGTPWDDLYLADNGDLVLGTDLDAELQYDESGDDRVELTGTGASLFIEDKLSLGVQTLTLTDDGTANDTLTPTASYVRIDVDEAANGGTPDLVFSETGAKDGDILIVVNNELDASEDTFTITDSAGVVNVNGSPKTIGPEDAVQFIYMNDRWVSIGFSDN